MKKILLLTILLTSFCVRNLKAQNAQNILDRAAAAITQSMGVTTDFAVNHPKMGSEIGKCMIKGRMFKIATKNLTIWSDAKTQWTYLKSTGEINITDPNKANQKLINPYAFLYLYKKGYALSAKSKGQICNVNMKAVNKNCDIPEAEITINLNGYIPQTIKYRQAGSWISIKINNFKKTPLTDKTFVCNPKEIPDAEVVDLR